MPHNLILTVAVFAQVELCPCGPFPGSWETLEIVFECMDTLCAGIHAELSMKLKLPNFDLSGLIFIVLLWSSSRNIWSNCLGLRAGGKGWELGRGWGENLWVMRT